MTSEKSLPCPFCGATPHHGQMKVEHCQLHGDPFQRYAIWCPKNHARVEGMHEALARTAWNTRATQPLSLTVDEGLVIARLRELLAKATPLPWVRANLANITTKFTQVAPNITSQHTAYRSTDDVLCTEAVNALPALLDRLQSRSLPVDIDRSGLAQEVDDISYAGVGP